jgi:hypothetical protein
VDGVLPSAMVGGGVSPSSRALGGLDYNFLFFQVSFCNVRCTVLDINPPLSQKKGAYLIFILFIFKLLLTFLSYV